MTAVIVTIAAGLVVSALLFNVGVALCGRLLGYPVQSFALGIGPVLASGKLGSTCYELRPLPAGGNVSFGAGADGTAFEHAHPVSRILSALAGPLATSLVAVAVGGTSMLGEIVATWPQIWGMLTHPGEPLGAVAALEAQRVAGGWVQGVAMVMAKVAAFNLGPLAFASGGIVLAELVRLVTGKPLNAGIAQVWLLTSLVVAVAVAALLVIKLATGQA